MAGKSRRKTNEDTFHVSVTADGYTAEQTRYMMACDNYRRKSGKLFLSVCDYLRVLRDLGYAPTTPPFYPPEEQEDEPCPKKKKKYRVCPTPRRTALLKSTKTT